MSRSLAVVKVGGSLFDWPDLATRLRQWLAAPENSGFDLLLVPGGGPTSDVVRQLDRRHALGEETSHWLALRALSLNAHFLASLLPSARVVADAEYGKEIHLSETMSILDVHAFARADENRCGSLPHSWAVTSDALAARVAAVMSARRLVLLKSTTIPPGIDWKEAGRLGLVDEIFAEIVRDAAPALQVSAVNLRAWSE